MKIKLLIVFLIISVLITFKFVLPEKDTKEDQNKDTNQQPEIVIKPLEYTISSMEANQGSYIQVMFNNIGDNKLRVVADITTETAQEIYQVGDTGYVYIPVPIATKIGNYTINIFNNEVLIKTYALKVTKGQFVIQHLTVSESLLNNTYNAKALQEYRDALAKAASYNLKERMFEDKFIMPVEGEITSSFGVIRYINKSKTPTTHYGIDIAADKGIPVKATASGVVVFSGYITSGGNYIIIDHGMGFLSFYAHMNSRVAKEGDVVKQGDVIGYVGSTGFSTGYHLHFNITIQEIAMSPWLFIEQ